LDPPRAGVESGAMADIVAMRAASISYVSCDPTTLARDLRSLTSAGYTIESITAIDLFPQTFHVETCVKLRR
jgi:23S rRNA (uracil1939-C5)-methyltransferase